MNLHKLKLFAVLTILVNLNMFSQVGIGTTTPDASTMLDIASTEKGFLIPRMTTTQRNAIVSPAIGLEIYNITTKIFNYFDGTVWQAFESEMRDNHVLVKSLSDLPVAVGGLITLNTNTVYEINGSISTNDKIDLNNTKIYGLDEISDHLIYTGTEELFTGSNGGTIRDLELNATNVSAQVFNLSDIGKTKTLHIRDVHIDNSQKVGTITGFRLVYIQNAEFYNNGDGFTFDGTSHLILSDLLFFGTNKGTMIKLVDGSAFDFIELTGGFFHVNAVNSAIGIDFGIGVTLTHGGDIETNFHGDGTRITGDVNKRWDLNAHGVDTQSDDVATGDYYITTPVTTQIAAANTPMKAAGNTTSVNLFRVTSTTNNSLTYEGTKTRAFKFTCSMSITSAANNKTFNIYLAKNGAVLPESRQETKIANGADVRGLSISGIVELSPGDYIEIWIENITDSTNVTIEALNLSIL